MAKRSLMLVVFLFLIIITNDIFELVDHLLEERHDCSGGFNADEIKIRLMLDFGEQCGILSVL